MLAYILFLASGKVKVTLEHATTAERGSRGITLLFLEPRR